MIASKAMNVVCVIICVLCRCRWIDRSIIILRSFYQKINKSFGVQID